MNDALAGIVKRVASIVGGLLLLIGIWWVKARLRGEPVIPNPSGPPVPAGRAVLTMDGAAVEITGLHAFIDHPERGAVRLSFESDTASFEGPIDLNGDGKANSKDDFPGDIDDVRSCDILKGLSIRVAGGDEEWVVLPQAGKCALIEAKIVPKEYWRPNTYDGTDGWRGAIELRVKVGGAEKTLSGTFEGPVTHVW